MTNPEISVIVPVYNVEKYLNKCVDSILRQTFRNIEIILVDDGSTDNSGRLCDEYLKIDERIRVFHKKNGGVSSARNYGLERATAPYFGFVDSDDYIAEDMYEVLYNNLKRENADMSMCYWYNVYSGGRTPHADIAENHYLVVDRQEAIRLAMEGRLASVHVWNKLYRRELFDTVKYPEGKINEDAFVIVDLLDLCDKIVLTTERKYCHVHRENSVMTGKFTESVCDDLEAYQHNYKIIQEKYPALIYWAEYRLCRVHYSILDRYFSTAESGEFVQIKNTSVRYLRKHFLFMMQNKRIAKSRKISLALLMLNENLYKMCVLMKNKRHRLL
jgi:glycosyltransferase involved in cell wall biosynthesis